MGKRKNLNGLPNSLSQRFFSTLFYYVGGYMPDWIWKIAFEYKTKQFKINILTGEFEPKEIKCFPIEHQLELLRSDISESLKREEIDQEYIKEAYFIIGIPEQYVALRMITCQAIVVGTEGRKIVGKVYSENSYGFHSDASSNSHKTEKSTTIFSKFMKWLKN